MEIQKTSSIMKFILPLYYILWWFLKPINAVQKNIHVNTKIIHDACINNSKGSTYVSNLQLFQNTIHIHIIYYIYYRMYDKHVIVLLPLSIKAVKRDYYKDYNNNYLGIIKVFYILILYMIVIKFLHRNVGIWHSRNRPSLLQITYYI